MKDNILLAFGSLKSNKMRSLLTMLGIIIGIGSVIAIVTVGNSMTSSINSTMSAFGTNQITVSLTSNDESSRIFSRSGYSEEDYINDEMIAEYKELFEDVIEGVLVTETVSSLTATYDSTDASLMTSGVGVDVIYSTGFELVSGRSFKDSDIEDAKNLCIIEEDLAELFFPYEEAIGQQIKVYNNTTIEYFYIIGIVESSDDDSSYSSSDEDIYMMYIPITTAKDMNNSDDGYTSITVVGDTTTDLDALLTNTEIFYASFYTHNESYTISATNPADMLESFTEMLTTVQLAISAIAAISLLVGGIGVMNIMLVSITERTREIGTRKALGAPNFDILSQFVIEAVVICLVGGILGIIVGVGLGSIASTIMGYPAAPSIPAIVFSVGFSMFIGLFFGYYPASKAAKLDPIDALRYE
ncbi:MAG: ABC transporter permease [Erysipelotrichaceae bacterium]